MRLWTCKITEICQVCGSPFNHDNKHHQLYHSKPIHLLSPHLFLDLLKKHLIFPNIEIDFGQIPDMDPDKKQKSKTLNLVFCPIDCDFQMKVNSKTGEHYFKLWDHMVTKHEKRWIEDWGYRIQFLNDMKLYFRQNQPEIRSLFQQELDQSQRNFKSSMGSPNDSQLQQSQSSDKI